MKDNLEIKRANFGEIEIKEAGEDGKLHIKAYVAAFGNVDSYGDIIEPGAFDEFLAGEEAGRMALCYQHDRNCVVGVITSKGVDDYGFWIEADVLPTSEGKDVQILLKAGAVKEFSIGYWAMEYHYEKREGYDEELRILTKVYVLEASPVTRAANPKAVLSGMKADDMADQIKGWSSAEILSMRDTLNAELCHRFNIALDK